MSFEEEMASNSSIDVDESKIILWIIIIIVIIIIITMMINLYRRKSR